MQHVFPLSLSRPIRWGLILILLVLSLALRALHTFATSAVTDRPWMNAALTPDQR